MTTVDIKTTGEHTDEELIEFMWLELVGGSCSNDNPFITGEAEIVRVEL